MSTIFINSYVYGGDFVGAFDDIPNLQHAWCPARRWLTAWNDFAIEIMNEDTEAIDQFGYTAEGNTDTAAILSWLSGSNGLIRTVPDQKTGDHVTQATKANMPLFVASGQNGRSVGSYNGTSQFLQGAYTSGGALSQPFSIYAVAQLDAAAINDDTYRYLLDSISAARMIMGKERLPIPDTWLVYAGTSLISAAAANSNWNIWSALFNGVSSQLWHNGSSLVSGAAGAQNATGLTIGRHATTNASFWKGPAATVVVADPSHGTTDREAVEAALGSYWSIP